MSLPNTVFEKANKNQKRIHHLSKECLHMKSISDTAAHLHPQHPEGHKKLNCERKAPVCQTEVPYEESSRQRWVHFMSNNKLTPLLVSKPQRAERAFCSLLCSDLSRRNQFECYWALERRTSSQKHLLLFQMTWIQLKEPIHLLTTTLTTVPGEPTPSSSCSWHEAHTYIQIKQLQS